MKSPIFQEELTHVSSNAVRENLSGILIKCDDKVCFTFCRKGVESEKVKLYV